MRFRGYEVSDELFDILNKPEVKIGQKILTIRIQRGCTQEKFSEYLNMSLNDYVMLESGMLDRSVGFYEEVLKDLNTITSSKYKSTTQAALSDVYGFKYVYITNKENHDLTFPKHETSFYLNYSETLSYSVKNTTNSYQSYESNVDVEPESVLHPERSYSF